MRYYGSIRYDFMVNTFIVSFYGIVNHLQLFYPVNVLNLVAVIVEAMVM